jgi:hypothetical protein
MTDEAQLYINKDGYRIPYGNQIPIKEQTGTRYKGDPRHAFFKGGIYVAVAKKIYRSIDSAQTWQLVHSAAGFANDNPQTLRVLNIRGELTLCYYYIDGSSSRMYMLKTTDGLNWTTFLVAHSQLVGDNYGGIIHNNYIYSMPAFTGFVNTRTRLNIFNFEATFPTFFAIAGFSESYGLGALCKHKGKIYHARLGARATGVTTTTFYDITGFSADLKHTITHTATGALADESRWAMFSDGTYIYLIHYGNNADGWSFFQIAISDTIAASPTRTITFADTNPDTITASSGNFITDGFESGMTLTVNGTTSNNGTYTLAMVAATTLTLVGGDTLTPEGPLSTDVTLEAISSTDITTTVRPPYMDTFGNSVGRAAIMADYFTDPTSPTFYIFSRIYQNNTIINQWGIHKWNGNSTEMSFVGFGGESFDSVNWQTGSQGHLFHGQVLRDLGKEAPRVEYTSKTVNSDSIDIEFTIYHGSGFPLRVTSNLLVDVSFYFSNGELNANPTQAATLSNSSHGTINGNTIEGLTMDNGATIYKVRWETVTDSITNGDRYILRAKAVNV